MRASEELRTLAHEAVDPDEAVSLCASLVREKSENPPGGEAGAAGVFAEKCRKLGAEVTVTEVAPGRPNVLARFPGYGDAPGLAFSGHLDVVPVGPEERGRWSLDPYGAEVVDGELWGRGSVDMKGGLSSAVAAGVSGVTGREAEFFAFPGTTDASYLVPAGLSCVICGPGDIARTHREDERIPVAALAEAARTYALAVIGFFER